MFYYPFPSHGGDYLIQIEGSQFTLNRRGLVICTSDDIEKFIDGLNKHLSATEVEHFRQELIAFYNGRPAVFAEEEEPVFVRALNDYVFNPSDKFKGKKSS